MKKLLIIGIAMLMVLGIGGKMGLAAPALTIDVDFWSTGNPVHNYAKGGIDTGQTIILNPCEIIYLDIYFSVTELGIVGGGFGLPFDPLNLEVVGGIQWSTSPMFFEFSKVIGPDYIGGEAALFPGTSAGPGGPFKFATIALHCIGPSIDQLYIQDYNVSAQWVTTGGDVLDGQLPQFIGTIVNTPIPGAIWLLGAGLLGLLGLKRKTK